jgi:hypothetical protein
MKRTRSRHVSFRLPADHAAMLVARAGELGVPVGALTRLLVMEALDGSRTALLEEEVTRLREKVGELAERHAAFEERFALAVKVLLVHAGKTAEADAQRFVERQRFP